MSSKPANRPEFLSTAQAARQLGLSLGAVQQMVESGVLSAWKTAGGHRRIRQDSVDKLLSRSAVAAPAGPPLNSNKLQVMVIEADPELSQRYQETMNSWQLDIELVLFDHLYDALLALGQHPPHLLIADLDTPGINGLELVQRLRNNPRLGTLPIALMSNTSDESDDQALLAQLPADITLYRQPIPFHQLHGYIEALIAQQHRQLAQV